MFRRLASLSALLALAAVAALALAERASAHAYLVRSTPEAGARLERAPRTAVLYFSENFANERVTVRLAGRFLDVPPPARVGMTLRQALPRGVKGVGVVNWSVVGDDGHPSLGEFAFAVGADAARAQLATAQRQPTPWALTGATWLFFIGLALALGGLVSERFVFARRGDREGSYLAAAPVGLGVFVAATGAVLHMVVLAGDRAGGLAELAKGAALGSVLDARAGRLTLAMLVLLLLAALSARSRRLPALAIASLLGTAVLSAARGHSGTAGHWWAVPADATHLAAAAIWMGALVHLVRVVYTARDRRREQLAAAARRYAALALITVAVAIVGGLLTALAQFGSLEQLLATGYGRTLLVKGALIAAALAVALTARTRALGLPWPELALLRRAGAFELASGAVVLLLLALLVGSSPVQLVSSLLFAATLLVCILAVRSALLAPEGGATALVVAGLSAIVAINAGLVAAGAAFFRQGWGGGGGVMIGTRVVLVVAAAGLVAGVVAPSLSRGGMLRVPLLLRLTSAETAALVGALAAAALLVNVAPPRALAVAAGPPAALGPPPLRGPAIRLADYTGLVAVGLAATERELRFRVVAPGERAEGLRLTAEAEPPGRVSEDLYPRQCGPGCFTIRYRLRPGQTVVTAKAYVPGFDSGETRFVVTWPPTRERPELLRRVAQTMLTEPRLEMTELVVSDTSSRRVPARYRLAGRELLEQAEMYRGGAVDVRVLGRDGALTQLAFALPASDIWYRMWVDRRHRVRREVIINRGHLITRTFRYPTG